MRRNLWLATSMAFIASTAFVGPRRARACGGCFSPPQVSASGAAAVVTAHRMAMAISPVQSTLWDQFAYSGDPEDFVWVLPASPESIVELADNRFFEALESRTNVQLGGTFAPPRTSCPSGCVGRGAGGDASSSFRPPPPPGTPPPPPPPPVMVHHEGTVGPFETATVSSDDPMALLEWLQMRGYAVPDALLPTIRYYGEMGLAFVALRLSPSEGVQRMQPVRVTFPGISYVLPLRMIAAGIADKVGLRLFVFAEGRYEAQNFPNATIDPLEVAYDWRTAGFTYDALFRETLASSEGRTWVTTYAGAVPFALGQTMRDDEGTYVLDDDLRVAQLGLDAPVLTRFEASLGVAALDRDLVLSLAAEESGVSNVFDVQRELNRPPDVTCAPLPPCGSAPPSSDGPDTEDCSASGKRGSHGPFGSLAVVLALSLVRRRRTKPARGTAHRCP